MTQVTCSRPGGPQVVPSLQPAPYIRDLPDGTFVSSGDKRYRVDENKARGINKVNEHGEHIVKPNLLPGWDFFSEGAVAQLPGLSGVSYVKTGDAWLLAAQPPLRVAKPLLLVQQAPWSGYSQYWIGLRKPYSKGRPLDRPLVILFNVPMSRVKVDDVFGAEEPPVFPSRYAIEEEIRVIVDLPWVAPEGQLVFSTEATAAVTRNHLARKIVLEVEKALSTPDIVLVAFIRGRLRKEVRFEDMFLVDLVQQSKGDFQATIAVRVEDIEF